MVSATHAPRRRAIIRRGAKRTRRRRQAAARRRRQHRYSHVVANDELHIPQHHLGLALQPACHHAARHGSLAVFVGRQHPRVAESHRPEVLGHVPSGAGAVCGRAKRARVGVDQAEGEGGAGGGVGQERRQRGGQVVGEFAQRAGRPCVEFEMRRERRRQGMEVRESIERI